MGTLNFDRAHLVWHQSYKEIKPVDVTIFIESRFPAANSVERRQNFCKQKVYCMKHNISFWNQSSKSLNVFSMFLAQVVYVSISSRVESYKTVFRCLTLWTESLPGIKAISLFQAFPASISTIIIDLVVCVYVQPCGMSLEYIPCWQMLTNLELMSPQ